MVVFYLRIEKTVCDDSRLQEMITFNFYDYKRKHFEASDILEKEKTLRNMLKPNTWKELEGMLQCDLDLKLLNHSGVIICLLVQLQLSRGKL